MKFGFGLPTRGPAATPGAIVALAERADALDFDYVYASDHIVIPRDIASRYPYSESGEFAGAATGSYVEQLTVLSFAAARTSRVRLLTSVMVLPHRSPVLAAKVLASIDYLSGGRLTVGCGVGWMREEFEAIGAPPFEERGAVGDEYIRAFRELWSSENPVFHGKYCDFSNVTFSPKPVQRPGPPIWVGGESPAALRRAGRLGDGWYPIANNPNYPLLTVEQYRAAVARVRRHAEVAGRDPGTLTLAYNAQRYDDRTAARLPDGSRQTFTGDPEQVAEDIRAFGREGVEHLIFRVQGDRLSEMVESLDRFVSKVRPLV
jgi:probable F420-dependent oxidoreductase